MSSAVIATITAFAVLMLIAKVESQPKIETSTNFKINILRCTLLMIVLGFLPSLIISRM